MDTKDIIDDYNLTATPDLMEKADQICRENYGDQVFIRGLIEFSNYCTQDCLYCGIRRSNRAVQRFRLTDDEILAAVQNGFKKGIRTFVLQSGEDSYFTILHLCRLTEKIRRLTDDGVRITLSCGIKRRSDYQALKQAGIQRYLIRFETSDPKLYRYLRNGLSLERRLKAINDLKECGFETGSGFMTGLPGETEATRINNALLCRKLELDMVGIGPFIPHPETPLKEAMRYDLELTLRMTALVRILLPRANLPATTAAGTLDPLGREKALQAGANVLMPNLTPAVYKKNYLLYPGKICLDEDGITCLNCLAKRVKTTGKKISLAYGDALSYQPMGKQILIHEQEE